MRPSSSFDTDARSVCEQFQFSVALLLRALATDQADIRTWGDVPGPIRGSWLRRL
jgi:hypothetical protein